MVCIRLRTQERDIFLDDNVKKLGVKTLEYLLPNNIYETRTVRILASVYFIADKIIAKMYRRVYDQRVRQDKKISVLKWYDMTPVHVISARDGVSPVDVCQRWVKKRREILADLTSLISTYNTYMKGVDLIDRIFHFFTLGISNSSILYRKFINSF